MAIRRPTAADYGWEHVARLGPALGITLLAVCRLLDTDGLDPIVPPRVAALIGKAPATTARDLHTLSDRGLLIRTTARGSTLVAYVVPREVLETITRLRPRR